MDLLAPGVPVTAIYLSLSTALVLFLAYRVTVFRRDEKVGIGDDGSKELKRAIRIHGNAIENLPLSLLLMLLLELNGLAAWALHLFGVVLIVSRIMHAYGMSQHAGLSVGRFYGTLANWLLMSVMIVLNLIYAVA